MAPGAGFRSLAQSARTSALAGATVGRARIRKRRAPPARRRAALATARQALLVAYTDRHRMADAHEIQTRPADGATEAASVSKARGVDGIAVEELERGRQEWWDAAFTALLLEPMPRGAFELVDLGCGTSHAAHALLAALPSARYLGVDIDAARIALCQSRLARWGDRARAVVGDATNLQLASASADIVLTVTTLEHIADVRKALDEIRRILRPGGRLIAVEPDNACQILRFDGPLPKLDEAFEALFAKLNRLRRPADLSLGPKLPHLLCEAGFVDTTVRVHMVQSVHREPSECFMDRLSSVIQTIAGAGALAPDDPDVAEAMRLLEGFRAELAGRTGFSFHGVPMWRCVGTVAAPNQAASC